MDSGYSDVLLATGEIAVALVGFAGIVFAFHRPLHGPALAASLGRFWSMLILGSGALLFSLLPFPFLSAGLSSRTAWSVCSVLMALFVGAHLLSAVRLGRRRAGAAPLPVAAFVRGGSAAAVVVLALNSIDVVFHRSFTGYFVGVLWLLAASLFFFARLIYLGLTEADPNGNSETSP